MFTGLIEQTGILRGRTRRGPGYRLAIRTELTGLEIGESVAVNGACLTVDALIGQGFEADTSVETAERTTLGALPIGSTVNLERSLRLGDRLGGHLVAGHVDAVAAVDELESLGDARRLWVTFPEALAPYLAAQGSVALDGVSLTVNAVRGSRLAVTIVPHTFQSTRLREVGPGSRLNLEVDLLARYVVRCLTAAAGGATTERGPAESPADDRPREDPLVRALQRAGILG